MFDTEKDLQCHLAKLPARCQDDAEILWKDVGVRSSAELTNLDPNDLIGFGYDRFAARYLPLEARIAGDRALPAGDADMAQTVGMPRMCVREYRLPRDVCSTDVQQEWGWWFFFFLFPSAARWILLRVCSLSQGMKCFSVPEIRWPMHSPLLLRL